MSGQFRCNSRAGSIKLGRPKADSKINPLARPALKTSLRVGLSSPPSPGTPAVTLKTPSREFDVAELSFSGNGSMLVPRIVKGAPDCHCPNPDNCQPLSHRFFDLKPGNSQTKLEAKRCVR